jgi:hypothetical protein
MRAVLECCASVQHEEAHFDDARPQSRWFSTPRNHIVGVCSDAIRGVRLDFGVLNSQLPCGEARRLSCSGVASAANGQRDQCLVCAVARHAESLYAVRGDDLRVAALA